MKEFDVFEGKQNLVFQIFRFFTVFDESENVKIYDVIIGITTH